MDLDEHIERFIGHFKGELESIESMKALRSIKTFKKALYVSVIDALSKCVYPRYKHTQNRERFVNFLMRFSRWQDGYKVSMPHLAQLLRLNPDPSFEKLRKVVFEAYQNSLAHRGQIIGIDEDLPYEKVRMSWPTQKEAIEGVKLESLQHFNLFYHFRNSLVHELRELGRGVEFDEDGDYPYYHGMTKLHGELEGKTIELVYPTGFLKKISDECLGNLKDYLVENKLDPYSYYRFGTYWISELNE